MCSGKGNIAGSAASVAMIVYQTLNHEDSFSLGQAQC